MLNLLFFVSSLFLSSAALANNFDLSSIINSFSINDEECKLQFLPNFCHLKNGNRVLIFSDKNSKKHYFEVNAEDNIINSNILQIKDKSPFSSGAISSFDIEKMTPLELLELQTTLEKVLLSTDEIAVSAVLKKINKKIKKLKPKNNFKITNEKNDVFDCSEVDQKSATVCSFLKCSSADKKKNYLLSFSLPRTAQSNQFASLLELDVVEGKEIQRTVKDNGPFNLYFNNQLEISIKNNSSFYNQEDHILSTNSELKENIDLVSFFTSAFYDATKPYLSQCSDRIKQIYENSSEHYLNLLAKIDLKLTLNQMKQLNFELPANLSETHCSLNGVYVNKVETDSVYNLLDKFQSKKSNSDGITIEKAYELFDKYANDKDLYWEYKKDGCYARAEIIVQDLAKQNIYSDKIWIQGKIDNGEPNTDIKWNYHVAPVIYITNPLTQIPSEYVLDPALFDRPVPKEEWLNKTNKNRERELVHSLIPGSSNTNAFARNIYSISNRFIYDFSSLNSTKDNQEILLKEAYDKIQSFKRENEYIKGLQKKAE